MTHKLKTALMDSALAEVPPVGQPGMWSKDFNSILYKAASICQ